MFQRCATTTLLAALLAFGVFASGCACCRPPAAQKQFAEQGQAPAAKPRAWFVVRFAQQDERTHAGMLACNRGEPLEMDTLLQQGFFFNTPVGLHELAEVHVEAGDGWRDDGLACLSADAKQSEVFVDYELPLPGSPGYEKPSGEKHPKLVADWVYWRLRIVRGQKTGHAGILLPVDPRNSSGPPSMGRYLHYATFVKDIYALNPLQLISTISPDRPSSYDESHWTRGLKPAEAEKFNATKREQFYELFEREPEGSGSR